MKKILKKDGVYKVLLTPNAGKCQFPLIRENYALLKEINAEIHFSYAALKHFANVGIYSMVYITDATNKRAPETCRKGYFLEEFEKLTNVPGEYTQLSFVRDNNGTERNFTNIGDDRWLLTKVNYNPPKPGDYNTDFSKPTTPVRVEAPKEQ